MKKKKKKSTTQPQLLSPENYIRNKSRNLPIYKCFISSNWKENEMANIFITRKHVTDNVTTCLYLVDLACLGLKDTFYTFNTPFEEVEEMMGESPSEMIEIPYELAHNIIYAGLKYAEKYGFKPHKDFTSITSHFLEEDNGTIPVIKVKCGGKDGKPMYMNTGDETSAQERQIINQLKRTAGKGNYHVVLIDKDDIDSFDPDDDDDFYDENDDDSFYDNNEDAFLAAEAKKIMAKIKHLDKKEQQYFFMQFLEEMSPKKHWSEDDISKIGLFTQILAYTITNPEAIKKQRALLNQKINFEIVANDQLPNSLFTGVDENIDGKTIATLFSTIIEKSLRKKNAKKAFAELREKIGDVPVIDFLNLLGKNRILIKRIRINKQRKKIKEYAQKHPHYFLIQLHYTAEMGHEKEAMQNLLCQRAYPLTEFEINIYAYSYIIFLISSESTELSDILAFEEFLEDIDGVSEETFAIVLAISRIFKLDKIAKYYET